MSILGKAAAFFKGLWGRSKEQIPKETRRLNKTELALLGFSPGSKRRTAVPPGRPLTREDTFSDRQVASAKAGKSKEKHTKARAEKSELPKPTSKRLKKPENYPKARRAPTQLHYTGLRRNETFAAIKKHGRAMMQVTARLMDGSYRNAEGTSWVSFPITYDGKNIDVVLQIEKKYGAENIVEYGLYVWRK